MNRIRYNAAADRLEIMSNPVHPLCCGEIIEVKLEGVWTPCVVCYSAETGWYLSHCPEDCGVEARLCAM